MIFSAPPRGRAGASWDGICEEATSTGCINLTPRHTATSRHRRMTHRIPVAYLDLRPLTGYETDSTFLVSRFREPGLAY